MTLGNHEFDEGDDFLAKYLNGLNPSISVLSANIKPAEDSVLKGLWKPYVIKNVNGEKVGIIGITTNQTKKISRPSEKIIFSDEMAASQKYIDELEQKGVNKIILLTHIGLDKDKILATSLRGVDIIIGGHSHTLMGDFSNVGLKSKEVYPFVATSKDGKKVCIAQAWQFYSVLGKLDATFDGNGDILGCGGKPTLLLVENFFKKENDKSVLLSEKESNALKKTILKNPNLEIIGENATVVEKLKPFKKQVLLEKNKVIAFASKQIKHSKTPSKNKTYRLEAI